MKSVYRVLAYIVAAEVAVQAMAIAYAVAGEGKWVTDGGVLDKAVIESRAFVFPEVLGYAVHGINGTMVIPALALLLLIFSFFAKIPGAVKWAGVVLLLVVVQISLGIFGHSIPVLGALHGLNALLLFSSAVYAARRGRRAPADAAVESPQRLGTSVR
jgi:heme A synthase